MKFKLLSVENTNESNIGDYVQSLAASQFLPHVDGFVNRESLSDYQGEECKVIMNGWYMHKPENWPPSQNIHPLFISMHINKLAEKQMLSPKSISYLKQFEPIGCRDYHTQEVLQEAGVDAYFSGCLTLTLGKKYGGMSKNDDVFFIDPYIPGGVPNIVLFQDFMFLLFHPIAVYKISCKTKVRPTIIRNLVKVSRFVRLYSKIFTRETLLHAKYISQENAYYATLENEKKLKEAERLVCLYSKAALVITGRIHCALPCLGMDTTVYYTKPEEEAEVSTCRFGGIMDLFNVIKVLPNNIYCDFEVNGKMSVKNSVPNKTNWKLLVNALASRCEQFINNTD